MAVKLEKESTSWASPVLLFLLMFCIFLQDLQLQAFIGTIARTPVFIVAPVIFLLLLLIDGRFRFSPLSRYYGVYYFVTVLTAVFLMIWTAVFVTAGTWSVYTETFPVKLLKASMYNLTYFFAAYCLAVLSWKSGLEAVYKILRFVFLFLLGYGLLQLVIKYPVPFFHNTITSEYHTRIVMTNSEPSLAFPMFAVVAFCFIALRFYFSKSVLLTWIYIAVTVLMLILIQSKAGLVFVLLAGLITLRRYFNLKIAAALIVIAIPVIYVIINEVIPAFVVDIELFASVSTRSTTFFASFLSLVQFPIGEGYGTYLYYFPKLLIPVNDALSNVAGVPLSTMELDDMINTGVNLPGKSGIPNEIIFNGISAVVFFIVLYRYGFRLSKTIRKPMVKIIMYSMMVFLLLTFLFGAVMETAYYMLIPFVLADAIVEDEKRLNEGRISGR